MTQYQYRDAQTGEFVAQEYAEAHPDVTVRETIAPACRGCNDTGTFVNDFGSEFPCSHVTGGEAVPAPAYQTSERLKVKFVDSTQPDPDYIYLPDLLALEADNKRLRSVLDMIVWQAGCGKCPDNTMADKNAYLNDIRTRGDEALSTPAPATSALWRVLDVLRKADAIKQGVGRRPSAEDADDAGEHIDLLLMDALKRTGALTPEDRALIEEMAKGGQE